MTDGLADPLAWLVLLPLFWAVLAFIAGPGRGAGLALAGMLAQTGWALHLAGTLLVGGPREHAVGGWAAPLGIALAVDGLSALMLLLVQAVALLVLLYARGYYPRGSADGAYFWPLAGCLVGGMNALLVSADLFNLYVGLELIGLSAVSLVAASGDVQPLRAALRYLFATLLGSGAYLLGVALIYASYGSVSLSTLTPLIEAQPPLSVQLAAALMLAGLLLKTALFPLHYWLPPAHGGAPAPVSALLSALVVKASFYLILRLGLGLYAPLMDAAAALLAVLGAGAILWGSWQAFRSIRLKMLIAYSTVAQLGYLFLIFPLLDRPDALQAGLLHTTAHALAKAGMFTAAGVVVKATGSDLINGLSGAASRLPLTLFALALAGMTLMGLPPSAGFLAKWLLLGAAIDAGQWPLVLIILAGGLLAAVYVFRVLRQAFMPAQREGAIVHVSRRMQWLAFVLAAASVALGLRAVEFVQLLGVGWQQ